MRKFIHFENYKSLLTSVLLAFSFEVVSLIEIVSVNKMLSNWIVLMLLFILPFEAHKVTVPCGICTYAEGYIFYSDSAFCNKRCLKFSIMT